ncbi:MAG: hypothetical protein EBS83_11375 [Planctomycetia bacterium]|nr:hypothetical protein [Planctomycetia bacterium]
MAAVVAGSLDRPVHRWLWVQLADATHISCPWHCHGRRETVSGGGDQLGPKRVSILGMKQLGEIGPDGKPMASQFLPRRYNAATELTASIEPQDNDLPFELSAQASANRR